MENQVPNLTQFVPRCTLVSLAPYEIRENRPSIVPYEYIISASDGKVPATLVISHGKSALYLMGRPDTFPVPIPVEELAEDLVNGHLTSQLEYSNDAHPAFFWIYGSLSPKEVLDKHRDKVSYYLNKQFAWFKKLVRTASDDWNKNHQRKFISDKHVFAAQALGVKEPWVDVAMTVEPVIELKDCPFCYFKVPAQALICMNCKSILNQAAVDKLQSQQVKVG